MRCQVGFSCLTEPQINWAWQRNTGVGRSGHLGGIAWRDDTHIGPRGPDSDVFLCVMRASKRGVRYAAADPDQLDRQVLVAAIDPHHFKWPIDSKRGDRISERDTTAQRQPRGHADHYLLRNADVYESFRKFFLKSSG